MKLFLLKINFLASNDTPTFSLNVVHSVIYNLYFGKARMRRFYFALY